MECFNQFGLEYQVPEGRKFEDLGLVSSLGSEVIRSWVSESYEERIGWGASRDFQVRESTLKYFWGEQLHRWAQVGTGGTSGHRWLRWAQVAQAGIGGHRWAPGEQFPRRQDLQCLPWDSRGQPGMTDPPKTSHRITKEKINWFHGVNITWVLKTENRLNVSEFLFFLWKQF